MAGSVFLDVCRFTPTAGGTTDWTFSAAVTGYQSPSAAGAINGAQYSYRAESADLSQWEIGIGTYTSSTGVLTRTTVLFNSAGTTAKINFSAAPQVAIVALSEDLSAGIQPQGRLTLTSGVAVTTSDVSGATTVYFTPTGLKLPIYNGNYFVPFNFSEISLALDATNTDAGYHSANTNFDVFAFVDTNGTLRIGTGPSWNSGAVAGSDTARGTGAGSTALQQIGGLWVNANTITLRWGNATGNTTSVAVSQATYLGTIRTTSAGQTEDSAVKRFVYNAYNQAMRQLLRNESTGSWTYSTGSYHQANASASNQVAYVAGLTGAPLNLQAVNIVLNSTSTPRLCYAGIGLDSTTVNGATVTGFTRNGDTTLSSPGGPMAFYNGATQLGYHYAAWLEQGGGADTQTWFGFSGSSKAGLFGNLWA